MTRKISKLSLIILILMVSQPLLDVVSYFVALAGIGNTLTLVLRMGVLAAAAIYGFLLSDRKKCYLISAGVLAAYWAVHMVFCFSVGYQSPVTDATNFVRVAQIVVYTLVFITFLRREEASFRTILAGICINFGIVALVMVLSTVTGTDPHTYGGRYGILGWFATANSQAAIISACAPIVLAAAMEYEGKNRYLVMLFATAATDLMLYFNGTRLAFATLLGCSVVLPVVLLLCGKRQWAKFAVLLLCAAVCVVFIKQSPMYRVQNGYAAAMDEKQGWAEGMKQPLPESESEMESRPQEEKKNLTEEELIYTLTPIYKWCAPNIVDRFGADRVIRKYNFSSTISEITAARRQKIYFCQMVQEDLPVTTTIFGMELNQTVHKGKIYDVENDFHGIYFLYGIAGLVLLLAFFGYFAVISLKALIRSPRGYFTPIAAAVDIALCIEMIYSYFTAGVLRRPNASFYLSVLLALCYYLAKGTERFPAKQK